MKDKVILSNDYTETFLSMAFQEGLLVSDKNKNDHIYEKYKTNVVDFNLAKSLLEQFLLSPYPILRKNLHESVEGKLLEDNQIFFDDGEIETVVPMNNYPTDLFLGILEGNGIKLSSTEFSSTINNIIKEKKEYDELEIEFGGVLPELGGFKDAIKQVLRTAKIDVVEEIEDERHLKLRALNKKAKQNLDKISSVIEFLELETLAEKHDANIKVKTKFGAFPENDEKIDSIINTQTLILKLVEKEFGYISLRTNSIKDTLLLAKTPEFIAYRTQLDEWINCLASGKQDGIEKIRREIKIARRFIDLKPIVEKGGNILAYIGVPLAFFPPTAIIGVGLSIAGIIPSITTYALDKKYKWAMINQVNQ